MNNKKLIVNIFRLMGVEIKEKNISINPAKNKVFTVNIPLKELKRLKYIDWSPLKYQRDFVSSDDFIRGIGLTIIDDKPFVEIPPIHLRLFPECTTTLNNKLKLQKIWAECLDGLQRVVSSIDKLFDAKFKLKKNTKIRGLKGEEIDIGDLNFKKIKSKHRNIYAERYDKLEITTKLYLDITDEQAMYLFSEILNLTNKMSAHMIRQATAYEIASVVRLFVKLTGSPEYYKGKEFLYKGKLIKRLKMFSYSIEPDNTQIFKYVKFDNTDLLQEETVASMFGFFNRQKYDNKTLNDLYKNKDFKDAVPGFSEFKNSIEGYDKIVTSSTRKGTERLSKWQVIVLYNLYETLRLNNLKITSPNIFMKEILTEWQTQMNNIMKGMEKSQFALDQNKSSDKAIIRALGVLMKAVLKNSKRFSIVKQDKRRKFSRDVCEQVLRYQNYNCPECDDELDIDDMIGGHSVMWFFGGETDIKNAKAIHLNCNKIDHFDKNIKKTNKVGEVWHGIRS